MVNNIHVDFTHATRPTQKDDAFSIATEAVKNLTLWHRINLRAQRRGRLIKFSVRFVFTGRSHDKHGFPKWRSRTRKGFILFFLPSGLGSCLVSLEKACQLYNANTFTNTLNSLSYLQQGKS